MLKYTIADVTVGLIKAFIFGGIVAIVGCYKGMTAGEGAKAWAGPPLKRWFMLHHHPHLQLFPHLDLNRCSICMIEVRHFRKVLAIHVILDDVSLRVETGESVVIIGAVGGERASLLNTSSACCLRLGQVLMTARTLSRWMSGQLLRVRHKFACYFRERRCSTP